MNVILIMGVFWTLYGIAGIFGFQVINERYRDHDWTGDYIRYRGVSWLMLGFPWLAVSLWTCRQGTDWPVTCLLLIACGTPAVVYSLFMEQKYRHMLTEK